MSSSKISTFCPVLITADGARHRICSPEVLIGRGDFCHFRVKDEFVSSLHAEIVLTSEGFILRDHRSTNGVFVDGKRVKRMPLQSGCRFRLGPEGPELEFDLDRTSPDVVLRPVGRDRPIWRIACFAAGLAFLVIFLASFSHLSEMRRRANASNGVCLIGLEDRGRLTLLGSGFWVSSDGWLATNAHVAEAMLDAPSPPDRWVAVPNSDPSQRWTIQETLIHPDHVPGQFRADLALLKIEGGPMKGSPLRLRDRMPQQAEEVLCLGYPENAVDLNAPRASVLRGIVSRVEDDLFFQLNLPVAPGLSGSPVLNDRFECIGLVVGRCPDIGTAQDLANQATVSDIGWAIRCSALQALMETSGVSRASSP